MNILGERDATGRSPSVPAAVLVESVPGIFTRPADEVFVATRRFSDLERMCRDDVALYRIKKGQLDGLLEFLDLPPVGNTTAWVVFKPERVVEYMKNIYWTKPGVLSEIDIAEAE